MTLQATTHSFMIGDKEVTLETGKLARQSDGAVVLRCGGTIVMATAVSAKTAKEGVDFMPLTVDYREKFSASGRFPGGFLKREARPSDHEILVCRLIDRALRPLFPSDYHADTQVLVNLLSYDGENLSDSMACLAASAALAVSDIPFQGAISEVRVARINGEFVINPTQSQMADPLMDMEIMVAATADSIVMVEGEMKEVSEADMLAAVKVAHEAIKVQCEAQLELAKKINAPAKREYSHETHDEEFRQRVYDACFEKCYEFAKKGTSKQERSEGFAAIKEEFVASLSEEELAEKEQYISEYYHDVEKKAMRRMILDDHQRLDGRKLDEIRPIWTEIDYLPFTHGSALFTRGETQSLTSITLGSKKEEQSIDGAIYQGSEKFILHYNFPPFSTGEARPMRGVSRREIGHGNLALRALKTMIPQDDKVNPYTIRVVSDILESNGSSSMATVCAGSMALMDAGIKIPKAVSGIAMGLVTENNKFAVLSDILGDEDHLGDMDFKVTGTKDGVTACQMDIKVGGLSYEIMQSALEQSRAGRLHILGEMNKTISEAKPDYKPHAPRIEVIEIPGDMIGAVIGPGGKIIQEIQAATNTVISIEEVDKKGIVQIASNNLDDINAALGRIKMIVAIPEVGEIYKGKVKSIQAYGAFVEILPGKDALLHISEVDHERVADVKDFLKEGDVIEVKIIGIDEKSGKMKLSRKVLLPKPERTA
ncbi:MAG: polyribonucleotide nucleotidyltransferase [Flavobacteriales bacterium]|nr:polyribonucleotide nucleotidyltransferase [Flavobacteriales bacterium]